MAKLNFNTFPYFDDYTPDQGFHRILFKPGYAVQARELTQLQTILQEQIKRMGDNIFKDGSIITGCPEATNFEMPYVKILDTDKFSTAISNDLLVDYEGLVLVGETTGVKAFIKKALPGNQSFSSTYKAFYIQYTSQGTDNETLTFAAGEALYLETNSSTTFVVAGSSVSPTGTGVLMTLGSGVVYIAGSFVLHAEQILVVEKFNSVPTKKVGFIFTEEIIGSETEQTLLDPAQGSFNYTAPGADRYKLTTELISYAPESVPAEGFYIIFDIVQGKIVRRYDKTQYAELNKTLARRTYDESGDYTVRSFGVIVREHLNDEAGNGGVFLSSEGGDSAQLAVGVLPGKAYVRGFEYELFSTTYLPVDKPTETKTRTGIPISTAFSNYIIVDNIVGTPLLKSTGQMIDLLKTATTTNVHGVARLESIEYHSGTIGTAACQYKLYLSDIMMMGSVFSSITFVSALGTTVAFKAQIVLENSIAVLHEAFWAPLIFSTTYPFTKTLAPNGLDNSFVYKKVFSGIEVDPSGNFIINSGAGGGETWSFTASTAATIAAEIICIAQTEPSGAATIGQFLGITITSISPSQIAGHVVTSSAVNFFATFIVSMQKTDVAPRTKTLKKDTFIKLQTSQKYTTVTASTGSPNLTGMSSITAADVLVGGTVYSDVGGVLTLLGSILSVDTVTPKLVLNANSAANLTSGAIHVQTHPYYDILTDTLRAPLTLGVHDIFQLQDIVYADSTDAWLTGTDLSSWATAARYFAVDGGQRDTFYDLGSLSRPATSTLSLRSKRFIVKVAFFQHDTSTTSGYFSIDSYPLPVQGVIPESTEIEWSQLPSYTASTGVKFNLRNAIDFRPTTSDLVLGTITEERLTASPTATVSAATYNPSNFTVTIFSSATSIQSLSGTSTTSTSNALVTGAGTLFTTQVSAGQNLYQSNGLLIGKVLTITDNTHLTLVANAAAAITATAMYITLSTISGVSGATAALCNHGDLVYDLTGIFLGTIQRHTTGDDTHIYLTAVSNAAVSANKIMVIHGNHAIRNFTTTVYTPHPQAEFISDVRWNLPRIDRIVLDAEGTFTTITGVASEIPEPQPEPDNAMTLGFVSMPAFPSTSPFFARKIGKKDLGTLSSTVDHRRYTMKDISSLDTSLQQLRRFTTLSFLEQKSINLLIQDAAGNDRFKNGILVDAFARNNIANINAVGYDAMVGEGILRPSVRREDIPLEVASTSTNIMQKAADANIVVRKSKSLGNYVVGEVVTSNAGATGTIRHIVVLGDTAENSSYLWVRLYLESVANTFVAANTITGGTSGVVGDISAIDTSVLAAALHPDLVSIPATSNLATLPYTHRVYSENPFASAAINTVNTVVFAYEGSIGLSPAADVWVDFRHPPEVVVKKIIEEEKKKPEDPPIVTIGPIVNPPPDPCLGAPQQSTNPKGCNYVVNPCADRPPQSTDPTGCNYVCPKQSTNPAACGYVPIYPPRCSDNDPCCYTTDCNEGPPDPCKGMTPEECHPCHDCENPCDTPDAQGYLPQCPPFVEPPYVGGPVVIIEEEIKVDDTGTLTTGSGGGGGGYYLDTNIDSDTLNSRMMM